MSTVPIKRSIEENINQETNIKRPIKENNTNEIKQDNNNQINKKEITTITAAKQPIQQPQAKIVAINVSEQGQERCLTSANIANKESWNCVRKTGLWGKGK